MRVEIAADGGRHSIHCRELGSGRAPLLHLHGGWGYEIYPLDPCVAELAPRYRILIPDRIGYGGSGRLERAMPLDFHRRAAEETLALMDALGIERAVLWGHSDGACTAVWMGLEAPERCVAVVLEALHFDRAKPRSKGFFQTMVKQPRAFGPKVAAMLATEHGETYWEDLLRYEGAVWLAIRETPHAYADLFDGRLGELTPPVLILHGAQDPRTEPGEIEAVRKALPGATARVIEVGGHCPHSEPAASGEATAALVGFLDGLELRL